MKTLVWVEHENGQVKDATLSAVSAAAQLGDVTLLLAGSDLSAIAKLAAQRHGDVKNEQLKW